MSKNKQNKQEKKKMSEENQEAVVEQQQEQEQEQVVDEKAASGLIDGGSISYTGVDPAREKESVDEEQDQQETPLEEAPVVATNVRRNAGKRTVNTDKGKKSKRVDAKTMDKHMSNLQISVDNLKTTLASGSKHTGDVAGQAHLAFYRRMTSILSLEEVLDAKELWTKLLELVAANEKELFNATTVYRQLQFWRGDQTEYELYRYLLYVLLKASPATLKDKAGTISVPKILSLLTDRQARNFTFIYNIA